MNSHYHSEQCLLESSDTDHDGKQTSYTSDEKTKLIQPKLPRDCLSEEEYRGKDEEIEEYRKLKFQPLSKRPIQARLEMVKIESGERNSHLRRPQNTGGSALFRERGTNVDVAADCGTLSRRSEKWQHGLHEENRTKTNGTVGKIS